MGVLVIKLVLDNNLTRVGMSKAAADGTPANSMASPAVRAARGGRDRRVGR
jgi:hypothetical protein